jgi:uncharacterized protein with NRDE domain
VCTVVVRWAPGLPHAALALRDELTGRDFDDPATWWPDRPGVVGGRDRVAGGSWCVTDVPSGTTALVLNRPQRRAAADGAPSRGVLPLLAVAHGRHWPEHVQLDGMASFALVLVSADALTVWVYDGEHLAHEELGEGTHMVTSGGAEDGKEQRYLSAFAATREPAAWRALVEAHPPADDPAALVVRLERDDRVYATVFGQVIEAGRGSLALSWSRRPWVAGSWSTHRWP